MAFRRPLRPLITYWAGRAFDRFAAALFSVQIIDPPVAPAMSSESAWVAAELRAVHARLAQETAVASPDVDVVDDLLTRMRDLEAYTPPVPVVPGAGS